MNAKVSPRQFITKSEARSYIHDVVREGIHANYDDKYGHNIFGPFCPIRRIFCNLYGSGTSGN